MDKAIFCKKNNIPDNVKVYSARRDVELPDFNATGAMVVIAGSSVSVKKQGHWNKVYSLDSLDENISVHIYPDIAKEMLKRGRKKELLSCIKTPHVLAEFIYFYGNNLYGSIGNAVDSVSKALPKNQQHCKSLLRSWKNDTDTSVHKHHALKQILAEITNDLMNATLKEDKKYFYNHRQGRVSTRRLKP